MLAKLEGYKTVIFFALVILVEIANYFGFGSFKLDSNQQEIIGLIVPVLGIILRAFTKSAVFSKAQG